MRRIAIAVALVLMLATASHAGQIFRYVTTDGTVSFTDTEKNIPSMYKDTAETVAFEGEFKKFDRLSIIMDPITEPITVPAPLLSKLVNRDFFDRDFDRAFVVCSGHISESSERVQFGDFNRTVYYVYDECGNLISATFSRTDVQIGR